MSKFDNAFESLATKTEGGSNNNYMAEHAPKLVELFGTQDKAKPRVGIISGIIELGIQELPDAEVKFEGNADAEQAILEKEKDVYFKDGLDPNTRAKVRLKCWPRKPQKAVAITVDFPQFQYDWGGNLGKKAVRFLMGGEITPKGGKPSDAVVSRPYDLKETTQDFSPVWSFPKKSLFHKLAVATNVIKANEPFGKHQLGKLIGKPALFDARLWLADGKYLNERITFKSEVPEGMNVPEFNEDDAYFVLFEGDNDPNAIKQLRRSVKNSIRKAKNYEGSRLQKEWGTVLFPDYNADSSVEFEEAKEPTPQTPSTQEDNEGEGEDFLNF